MYDKVTEKLIYAEDILLMSYDKAKTGIHSEYA